MIRALLSGIALLSVSCVTPTQCISRCGMRALNGTWSCADFQDTENLALLAFADPAVIAYDAKFKNACRALQGWNIYVVDSLNFTHSQTGELVGGETMCTMRWSAVGNSAPQVGRLAHEMAHMIQDCVPAFHQGWEPIEAALRREGLPE